jgi:APA family basic amino acid/polyamine antiporter
MRHAEIASADPPSRLARKLGTFDAVAIGLGAMIGAGVFAAFGPAARAAGNGLPIGLAIAALVAWCNATSSAELAAVHPESGGAYVYGRKRLGKLWGFLAGFGFVAGKLASCAAMALTFGSYAAPELARPLAVGAIVALTAVNLLGIEKTALVTRLIVALVLASLAVVVSAVWRGGAARVEHLWPISTSAPGVLQSAGFLFFAFAGYARIATLGEEVVDPARTIPRAVPIALGTVLVVYATVGISALAGAGADALASSSVPLATAVEAGELRALVPVVRIGAAIASLGVLLSLIAGVSRTIFAMASNRDLPSFLAAVHPRRRVPHRAEILVGAIAAIAAATLDLHDAIGFSSFAVLAYYAVANASALTLGREQRLWPRGWAIAGLIGCATLAFTLPAHAVIAGASLFVLAASLHGLRRRRA